MMGRPQSLSTQVPVYSVFADDPDFAELLDMFIVTLAERREALEQSFESKDFHQLRVHAHQLKGAGGGYGFDGLTTVAAALEQACKDQNIDQIGQTLDVAVSYIDRITV